MDARVGDWKNPSYAAVYRERLARYRLLSRDDYQLAVHLKHYGSNPIDLIEDWFDTYDPRLIPKGQRPNLPFILFDKQREFITWLCEREADPELKIGAAEKSRDVGVSWLFAAYMVWSWLMRPGSAITYGSYTQDRVDELGVMGSQLEKCRAIIRGLPDFLKPEGFSETTDLLHGRLLNRENGSTIVGEVGDQIGRGDRAVLVIIDEAAFLKHPEKVDAACSQTADCRIYASTAHGQGAFYQKIKGGTYPRFRFHWRDDPRKDDAWYERQRLTLPAVIVASEIDINHEASIEDICCPSEWITIARSKELLELLGDLPDYGYGIAGLDVATGGSSKNVYIARFGPIVRPPRSWRGAHGESGATAHRAADLARADGVALLNFDSIGVGEGVATTLKNLRVEIVERISEGELGVDEVDRLVNRVASFEPVPTERTRTELIRTAPINVGVPASEFVYWPDGKTSREKFANTKAEIWWTMRDRLEKTYETWLSLTGRDGGRLHPVEELLLLPDDDELCSQLSVPTYRLVGAGKIAIERKEQLAARGVASPDFAEALSLTFVPAPPVMEEGQLEGLF